MKLSKIILPILVLAIAQVEAGVRIIRRSPKVVRRVQVRRNILACNLGCRLPNRPRVVIRRPNHVRRVILAHKVVKHHPNRVAIIRKQMIRKPVQKSKVVLAKKIQARVKPNAKPVKKAKPAARPQPKKAQKPAQRRPAHQASRIITANIPMAELAMLPMEQVELNTVKAGPNRFSASFMGQTINAVIDGNQITFADATGSFRKTATLPQAINGAKSVNVVMKRTGTLTLKIQI